MIFRSKGERVMFRHEIPWDITGEEAEQILDEVRKIEPDAYLEITFAIRHGGLDRWERIDTMLKEWLDD